mmetsp:Transcript_11712/g.22782  ORF Transcript_11712/g.22782 Transcript_11712/m.22782 type:complete len:367 (-) Transcript_11712:106-1206(-)
MGSCHRRRSTRHHPLNRFTMAVSKRSPIFLILLILVASTSLISPSSASSCRHRDFTHSTTATFLHALDTRKHEAQKPSVYSRRSANAAAFVNYVSIPGNSKINFGRSISGVSSVVSTLSTIYLPGSLFKSKSRSRSTTSLFGKINFIGVASAKVTGERDGAGNKSSTSLKEFLLTSASDSVLLGMKNSGNQVGISQCEKIDGSDCFQNNGELWECRQASIEWFGLTLVPVFVNGIERSIPSSSSNEGNVVISIIDAKTEVRSGGRLGSTLSSAMKRSVFEGRNVVRWEEHSTNSKDHDEGTFKHKYTLEGNIKLNLTINLPPFLPLPPGFNTIGSKIVERTCRDRLRQNLDDISAAYLQWANSKDK